MIPDSFAIIGALIASIGGLYYLYETIVGTAQPNRITWLLWALFPMITFVAQRAQGVEGLSWATFAAGFMPFLILLASFINRRVYWKTEKRDYYLMAAAILGIALWAITDNPNVAISLSLVADLLAGMPTLIKSYNHPETESWIAYAIGTFGFGMGVLAIQTYTFENYAFIGYLFVLNLVLAVLASRKNAKSPLHVEL